MISPDDASDLVGKYFEKATDEEFARDVARIAPSVGEGNDEQGKPTPQLVLHPHRARLPLTAYLASALTNLTEEQRQLIFQLSDTVSTICAEFDISVYEPRKQTDPVHHADVPASDVFRIDRERVLASDLIIHLGHFPSTGVGEELDFAHTALLPILQIYHGSTRLSRMVSGIPGLSVEISYNDPDDLRTELYRTLEEIRPILEQRKMAFAAYDRNVVGEKVRLLREGQGLTRDDIASAAGDWVTLDFLTQLEESSDRIANPSLIQLREVATLLKTTVAELVEPDLGEQLVTILNDLMAQPAAARFSGVTDRDRRRLLRAMMRRILESLEEEGEDVE